LRNISFEEKFKAISVLASLFLLTLPNIGYADTLAENEANKAARIRIAGSVFEKEIAGRKAPEGKIFVVLDTQWENIHPKQKIDKDKLEGKIDRSMGVSGLAGRKKEKKVEYVEADVAYQVNKLYDHIYLLADGLAFSLHEAMEDIPGGYKLQKPFSISKQGDIREVKLVYLIPEGMENLSFMLFDYQYGHITVPVKGSLDRARGEGEPSGKILGWAKTDMVELAARALDFQPGYEGKAAPKGWRFAVVHISGKSLSGGNIRNIVQFKTEEYTWVTTDGGYLYSCSESSTAMYGNIRFTPEIYQLHELAFLVPEAAKNFRLSIRAQNKVLHLDLTEKSPLGMPEEKVKHRDGDIMEVLVFGTRKEKGKVIIDLGIRSLSDRAGLEIQMGQQFFLQAGEQEHRVDTEATASLMYHPPKPFIVPPGMSVRFELAFSTDEVPASLRFRGYRSQGQLKL
jgi:hypothetical protein